MVDGLDTQSSDIAAMQAYWALITAIMGGTETMRAGGNAYLPKFTNESDADHLVRVKTAPFENIFSDIVGSLAATPFSKEVAIKDGTASPEILEFIEDVDGAGNHIHNFGAELFDAGIQDAIGWILVDHHEVAEGSTLKDKRESGARPYFVRIEAKDLIAVHSDVVKGREIITHFRFCENVTSQSGFEETTVNRIRVFERQAIEDEYGNVVDYAAPTFEVFEKAETEKTKEQTWKSVKSGTFGIGEIPVVPFLTGRRKGLSWEIIPPMQAAADLQIEHFQLSSALKYSTQMTAFTMLQGKGINPPIGENGEPMVAPVGPMAVLYAPPSQQDGSFGEWALLEPTTASLKFLAERLKDTGVQIRELGRQPLTAGSAHITVIAAAFASKKANSAAQQWAFNLKDTLENALKLMARWSKQSSAAEVLVHTDFDVGSGAENDVATLSVARKNGDISRVTYLHELKRRGTLSAEFDEATDLVQLNDEYPTDDLDAAG